MASTRCLIYSKHDVKRKNEIENSESTVNQKLDLSFITNTNFDRIISSVCGIFKGLGRRMFESLELLGESSELN